MKKFRHLWLSILTLVLSVSIIIGGAGLSAFAETTGTEIIGSAAVLPASVYLGEEVTVTATGVTVTAPNGKEVTLTGDNKFVAEMLGNYTVEYEKDGKTYTHTVGVTLKTDYELRVVGDGAAIPTYTNTETEYTLPTATLYKKNDDDEYVAMDRDDYDLAIYVNNAKVTSNKQKFSLGKNSVQYDAVIKGTQKHFTKQYDVNAQMSFEDKVRPTISISGVPTDASLNTKVTLPKATATDNFDSNVEIKVSVSFNGQPVKKVETNKYGYANKTLEADETFDNVYDMSFYPREQGTYVVEYQAVDDAGNVSVKQPFNIKVQDRTAPKLENIDDDTIPSTWGLSVVNKDNNASGDIVFPYPEYSDNNSEKISVSFEIRDTVNNNTVIRFENIYDYDGDTAGSGAKYKYDESNKSKGLYDKDGEEVTFTKNGFTFNFNDYKLGSDLTKTGKYTAIYNARDEKPNSTTKSYDIDLQDTFTDKLEPSVELNADKYIYVSTTETKYTLPTATVSDAVDSKPSVTYTLKIGEKSVVVENGEEISVWCKDNKLFVKYSGNENGEEFVMQNKATLAIEATDDAGNTNDSVKKEITLAVESDITNAANVTLSINGDDITPASDGATYELGKKFDLGKLTIGSFELGYRDFVGVEMYMKNPAGDIIDGLDFETYVDENSGKYQINVDKITFIPAQATETDKPYVLTVRAFDITGRSLVQSFDITVNVKAGGNRPSISAASIPTSGNINVAYRLKNESYDAEGVDENKKYIVRRISNAGRFSLMGIEFTAYTTGTVTFTDGYYKTGNEFASIGEKYSLKATDNSNIEFDVLGLMPVQAPKAERTAGYKNNYNAADTKWIKLPEVIAYNEYANADVTIKVTTPTTSGSSRTYSFDPKQNKNEDSDYIQYDETANQYYIFATMDGEYKVEYSASVGGASATPKSFTIRVGDTVPPTFTTEGNNYGATARQNGSFRFKTVKLGAEDEGSIADITFTKRLLDPSGNEVYSVSDKGTTGANKTTPSKDETYTFTMTGMYTVEYTATDKAGNSSVYQDTINVSATDSTGAMPLKVLRTVLIIVGVILIAGVILYFVRFRKVKESDVKKK